MCGSDRKDESKRNNVEDLNLEIKTHLQFVSAQMMSFYAKAKNPPVELAQKCLVMKEMIRYLEEGQIQPLQDVVKNNPQYNKHFSFFGLSPKSGTQKLLEKVINTKATEAEKKSFAY